MVAGVSSVIGGPRLALTLCPVAHGAETIGPSLVSDIINPAGQQSKRD
jgi:hypothetical protein